LGWEENGYRGHTEFLRGRAEMDKEYGRLANKRVYYNAMAKLTVLERKAVEGLLEGKSQTQAMLDAGYSEGMAQKQQKKVFSRERVRTAIVAAMEDMGIDVEMLTQVLRDGLSADRVIGSKLGDMMSLPDHGIRHKFLLTALELRGEFPQKEERLVTETYEEKIFRIRGIKWEGQ